LNRRTPLKIAGWALILCVLAYAAAQCIAWAAETITLADTANRWAWPPLATWLFLTATLAYWSVFGIALSAMACGLIYFGYRKERSRQFWKTMIWTCSTLVVVVVFPLAFMVWAFLGPPLTRNPAMLKAIKTEAHTLMANHVGYIYAETAYPMRGGWIARSKNQLPRIIGRLDPQEVTVSRTDVDILISGFFDGGWGYFVPLDEHEQPQPEGRFEYLGQGVYSYHPY
jgi:hypothetical protein